MRAAISSTATTSCTRRITSEPGSWRRRSMRSSRSVSARAGGRHRRLERCSSPCGRPAMRSPVDRGCAPPGRFGARARAALPALRGDPAALTRPLTPHPVLPRCAREVLFSPPSPSGRRSRSGGHRSSFTSYFVRTLFRVDRARRSLQALGAVTGRAGLERPWRLAFDRTPGAP